MGILSFFLYQREAVRVGREADNIQEKCGDRAFDLAMLRLYFAKADNDAVRVEFMKKVVAEICRRDKRQQIIAAALENKASREFGSRDKE